MSISLSKLLSDVSISVQKANTLIDMYMSDTYIENGYDTLASDSKDKIKPKAYKIVMLNGQDEISVPKSILMNHKSIQLDEIDFKIKVALSEDEIDPNNGDLLVDIKSDNDNSNLVSEINLHFKSAPTPEGTARIQSKYLQDL